MNSMKERNGQIDRISRLVILLAVAVLIIGCGQEQKQPGGDALTGGAGPDQVTSKARLYLYSGGHKTTDLRADELVQYTRLDSSIAINLDALFFDTAGVVVSTLRANRGYIRERDNFLAVSGGVLVIGRDSVKVKTEYLEWDAGRELVETDSFVTVIRQDDTLFSYGIVSDPELKDITFKKQVSGTLTDVEKMRHEKK